MPCPPVTGKGLYPGTQYVLIMVFARAGNVPRCLVEEEMYQPPGKGIGELCDDRNPLLGDRNCIQNGRKMRKKLVRTLAEMLGLLLCPIVCTTLSIFFSLFRSPLYPRTTQRALSSWYRYSVGTAPDNNRRPLESPSAYSTSSVIGVFPC